MASTERNGVRYFNCCICEDIFEGYGNNPYPITNEDGNLFWDEEECCDSCNNTKVMPERFKQMGLV